jgi:hypothetical protein
MALINLQTHTVQMMVSVSDVTHRRVSTVNASRGFSFNEDAVLQSFEEIAGAMERVREMFSLWRRGCPVAHMEETVASLERIVFGAFITSALQHF